MRETEGKESDMKIAETMFFCEKNGFRLNYAMCINRRDIRKDRKCRGCRKGEKIKEEMRKER